MITLLANLVINPNEPKKYYLGDGDELVVRIPADMKMFKTYTMGKTLVMGHNTFNQTGPLKGREILVLSRKDMFCTEPDVTFMKEINWDALQRMEKEFVVCGGTSVYTEALPFANKLRLTMTELFPVDIGTYIGDKMFPDFNEFGPWSLELVSPTVKQAGCQTGRGHKVDNFFVAEYTK